MSHTLEQQEAIESWDRGDVCVVAGPGSGKTRVLVERVRWLVERKRVLPERVLAITFTRKAAANMYQRLIAGVGPKDSLRQDYERVSISTIHAFCARLLREHALDIGVDPEFQLLEPADAGFEVRRAIEAALDEVYAENPRAAHEFLRAFRAPNGRLEDLDASNVHRQMVNLVRLLHEQGQQPFAKRIEGDGFNVQRDWVVQAAQRSIAEFQLWKRKRTFLDYPDLEQLTVRLLDGDVALRNRFEHILVDENQDTNPLQARLIDRLREHCGGAAVTLFVVGDPNQSIYGFRNADPQVFLRFRDDLAKRGGHLIELFKNFRSRPEILEAAATLTAKSDGIEPHALSSERPFAAKDEPSVEIQIVRDPKGDPKTREARWVAHRILELRRTLEIGAAEGRPAFKDFAILVRTNKLLTAFAEGLRQAGIPYQVNAGRDFFEVEEVRDTLAMLRVIDNPRDEINLAATMRSPFGGIADETLLRLKQDRRNLAEAIWHPPELPSAQRNKVDLFRRRLEDWRARREDAPLGVFIQRLLAETGYERWLLAQPSGLLRSANVRKLARIAARTAEGDFAAQVDRLDRLRAFAPEEAQATLPQDSADAVHLMTVHTAKGLEFPIVILGSIQARSGGQSDHLLYSPESGVGVLWVNDEKDEAYTRVHALRKKSQVAEADRIFYVGLTRAEEHLVLSASFGGAPRGDGWAKHLKCSLGVDLTEIANAPRIEEKKGCRYRLFTTDQEPPPSFESSAAAERDNLVWVEPRAPGGQADSEAPVTAVSTFAACPRRYYLSRYLRLEAESAAVDIKPGEIDDEDPPATGGPELGRQVHEILAGTLEPGKYEEAAALARVFEQSDLGRRAAGAEHVERELNLVFPVDGRLLRGQIDLYFRDAAGGVLVDYKTDLVQGKEISERARHYALQLQLYALALEKRGERPKLAALHFLRPDKIVEVDLSDPALAQARSHVERLFEAQRALLFPLDVGPHCRSCPHFGKLCPADPRDPRPEAHPSGQFLLSF